jgi:hypothetical protein
MSDYSKLKELAEATKGWDNLKSCWPEETEDGDLEVNWFVGAVTEDDDKYPVLEVNTAQYDALEDAGRLARYYAAANPSAVLALIAENEALKGPHDWLAEDLIKELVDNVQAIQENADDGEDDPFVIVLLASASRIRRQEANIDKLRAENERLKAENAGLKTGYEAYEQVNAELKAEVEGLRREREGKVLCDLELFETLRDSANTEADEHRQCMATYRPLRQANLDSVVKKCDDLLAAMGKGEQA